MAVMINLMMIIGVWRNQWPAFLVIYGFWLETLIISFFTSLKITFASGEGQIAPHILKGIKFMLIRIAILSFYLIFIVVFLGVMHVPKTEFPKIMLSISFKDPVFNTTIAGFFLACIMDFIFNYWFNNMRMSKPPSYFFSFIDARTLIIHVVVVLGTFVFIMAEKHFPDNKTYMGTAGFLTLFIIIKSIGDIVTIKLGRQNPTSEVDDTFI